MKVQRFPSVTLLIILLAGCVTINVYFPAAAAQEAADRIIRDVYGEQVAPKGGAEQAPSGPQGKVLPGAETTALAILNFFVSPVYAEADISIQTPAIQQLRAKLKDRHGQLATFYGSGAVGMTRNGFIEIRDMKAIALRDRSRVQQLVSAENTEREALYSEIARANGHPEWKADIQATFAKRWIANAPGGWWHQNDQGQWVKK